MDPPVLDVSHSEGPDDFAPFPPSLSHSLSPGGGTPAAPGGAEPPPRAPSVGPARPGLQNGAGSLLLAAAPRLSHNRDL